jgi:hypothetical protein
MKFLARTIISVTVGVLLLIPILGIYGAVSPPSNVVSCTTSNGPPTSPFNLTIMSVQTNSVALRWSYAVGANSPATEFRVERSTTVSNSFVQIAVVTPISNTNYTDSTVASGTPYFYRVLAAN